MWFCDSVLNSVFIALFPIKTKEERKKQTNKNPKPWKKSLKKKEREK